MKPLILIAAALALPLRLSADFAFHHENVLGTSMELRVHTESEEAAGRVESVVLEEIDRLSGILNGWSPDSGFSRWQQSAGEMRRVSKELLAVLAACDAWCERSGGAFQPKIGPLAGLWSAAAKNDKLPSRDELARAVAKAREPAWKLDAESGSAMYLARPGEVSLDALAKGWIIDRALDKAAAQSGIEGVVLNIGGDLSVCGNVSQSVSIADPKSDAENAGPLDTVTLFNQAMATSGGYRKGWEIGGKRHSHIIDPRTGWTADGVASASVIAPDAATADALATIFSILTPAESLAMADALDGVACLVVGSDGKQHASRRWGAGVMPVETEAAGGGPMELVVEIELNKPEAARYLRPYVAIWIEDEDGFPVRTLSLWLLKGRKGLNWLPDLKRWSRSDKTRRLAEASDIVPVISSATRNPGKYSVVWDGLDQDKQPLPAGSYTLFIEAAREKGTYQLIKHPFGWNGQAFKAELEGNIEVKSAVVESRAKPQAD